MSEDKLSQEARKAYAEAQKDFDEAAQRSQEKEAEEAQDSAAEEEDTKSSSAAKAKKSKKDSKKSAEKSKDDAKKHTSNQAASGDDATEAAELDEELAKAQEERIEQLKDDLARSRADVYNLQQEYNAYVRRTKAEVPMQQELGIADVVNSLMGVLDEIALARQHGDLTGPFEAVATKLESTLEGKYQVKRYGESGDVFDPNLHQAIQMEETDGEDREKVISQVAQPGYLMGDKVLRPAMVIVGLAKKDE